MRPSLLALAGGAGLAAALLARRQTPTPIPAPPPPPPEFTLVATGDVMMHADVKQAAAQQGFGALWSGIAPAWKAADLAFANLETPVAPETGRPGRPYQFNAPADLPEALKAAGLQVLSTANNHAFDQGPKGVAETLQRLRAAGLVPVGTGDTRAEAEQTVYLDRKGLKVAFLAFSDIFNNDLDGKASRPWVRKLDLDAACAAVAEARSKADAVLVSIHWGIEDHHAPTPRQQEAAAQLVAAGADVILGHHPHVLQPVAWVLAGGRTGLVAYSLGNFISNQDRTYRASDPLPLGDERDGLLLKVVLRKAAQGVEIVSAEAEPLWCENNWRDRREGRVIRTVPLDGATAGLPLARAARIRAIVGPRVPELSPAAPPAAATGSPSGPAPAGARP